MGLKFETRIAETPWKVSASFKLDAPCALTDSDFCIL